MNYNQYTNPKATQASKTLATATFLIALIGIVAAVKLMAKGVHPLFAILIILAVLMLVLLRPRIESRIVTKILDGDGLGPEKD